MFKQKTLHLHMLLFTVLLTILITIMFTGCNSEKQTDNTDEYSDEKNSIISTIVSVNTMKYSSQGAYICGIISETGEVQYLSIDIYGDMGKIIHEYTITEDYVLYSYLYIAYEEPFYINPENVPIQQVVTNRYYLSEGQIFDCSYDNIVELSPEHYENKIAEMQDYINTLYEELDGANNTTDARLPLFDLNNPPNEWELPDYVEDWQTYCLDNKDIWITASDYRIGDFRLIMPLDDVYQYISSDICEEIEFDSGDYVEKTLILLNSLVLVFIETYDDSFSLHSVEVSGTEYATPRGLRIGDTAEKLFELYGMPWYITNNVWTYLDEGWGNEILHITVVDSIVQKIYLHGSI